MWRFSFAFRLISCHLTLLIFRSLSKNYKQLYPKDDEACSKRHIGKCFGHCYIQCKCEVMSILYTHHCYILIILIIYSMYSLHYFKCTFSLTRQLISSNITRLNKSNFIKQKSILSSPLYLKLIM